MPTSMLVQKVVSPGGDTSWTVVDECFEPVEPVEVYLAHLEAIERSPNTLRAYASSLRLFFEFLVVRDVEWDAVGLDEVGRFVSWLRRPGDDVVIPIDTSVSARAASTVNRHLAAVFGLYDFHARRGLAVAAELVQCPPTPDASTWPCTSNRSPPRLPPTASGASWPAWSPGAGPTPPRAAWSTPTWRWPPPTPGPSPRVWPGESRSSSPSRSRSPCTPKANRPAGNSRPGAGRASLGGRPASELKVLGDAEAGSRRPVALAVADSRHHLHVMGATGSGKSTLLINLVLEDIEAGRGAVVVDPKGDLVTDICDRLPAGAEARTVLIDPAERQAPPVLNVLAGPGPDLVVDNLVGIFRNIFAAYWGPRTDDVLRAACLTLRRTDTEDHPASLADVPRLLSDEGFRAPRVAAVKDDSVGLGGFWRWYDQLGTAAQSQVAGPLMNKLRAFLLRDFARQVVGRGHSSIDMGKVLDGGICLVRVPKGILGDDTARLLGSFIVAAVWQAATHRARLGQAARVDCSLYVDECQNFLNLPRSFEELLAEARGYRLSLVLAHQHLAQLPRELRDAVSSNARTKVWFSMSPEDAHVLGRHVAPEVTEHDLAHLGAYQAAARLVVDGRETPACTLRTRPAPPATCGRAEAVAAAAARATFGCPVEPATDTVSVDTAPEAMATEARAPGGGSGR
jgi:hypothetical protein